LSFFPIRFSFLFVVRAYCSVYQRGEIHEDIQPKRIRVETMSEIDELRVARGRTRELEAALADARMEHCLESAFLDIARERLGMGTEELKKSVLTPAERRKRKGMA
jgi:hypothetical protein